MIVVRVLILLLIAHRACVCDGLQIYETELFGRPANALTANVTLHPYPVLLRWIIRVLIKESTEFWQQWSLLHKQNDIKDAPPKWITLNLQGRATDSTTLLVRSDSLYLVGFNTSNGVWYAFRGYQHLIPNSIELPYEVSYSSLFGLQKGGKWRLPHLALGLEYYLDSLGALSDGPSNGRMNLGIAMAKMLVMTVEAARIKPIGDLVGWYWTSQEPGYIDTTLVKYIVSWGDMSYLVLCSRDGFPWGGEKAPELFRYGIANRGDALSVLTIVIYPMAYNPDNPDNCRSTTLPARGSYPYQNPRGSYWQSQNGN